MWTDGTVIWPNIHPAKLLTLNLESGAVADRRINTVCNMDGMCTEVFAVK